MFRGLEFYIISSYMYPRATFFFALAKFPIICFRSQEWERQREAKKKEQEAALAAEEDEAKPVDDMPKPVDNRTQSEIESDEVEKLCNSVYKVEIRYSSSN